MGTQQGCATELVSLRACGIYRLSRVRRSELGPDRRIPTWRGDAQMRSWLVVSANEAEKLEQAAGSGADAVVVDLDLEMGTSHREEARERVRDWLARPRLQVVEGRQFTRWVRISPLGSRPWRADLFTVDRKSVV